MTLDQLNEGIDNWRNHFKDRRSQRITPSLEGRYKRRRSDFDYEDSELEPPPDAPSKPIDLKLALKFEKEIIQLPYKYKYTFVVQEEYPEALNHRNFRRTCKIGGISGQNDWDLHYKKAKLMLMNRMK